MGHVLGAKNSFAAPRLTMPFDSRARAATSPQVENAQELSLDLPARRRPMSRRRVPGAAPPVAQF